MNRIITVIITLLVLGGAVVFIANNNGKQAATQPTNNTKQSEDTSTDTSEQPAMQKTADTSATPAATITYTNSGFSPSSLTVKAGDTVKVVNNSSRPLEFSSDPHPVHTQDADLNQSTLQPGASQTFVVTKTGTFGFHDHLNSSNTGTITIQ